MILCHCIGLGNVVGRKLQGEFVDKEEKLLVDFYNEVGL